ncbi:MAG: DUF1616 domain-containing protein [Candidatus Nanoarchaeia archaeon]|nr:DUF1616 domain-containing protein [Candidatus Nanoarchaeia archaeon]
MNIKNMFLTIIGLFTVSIILSFFQLTLVESLRVVFGAFYILFLPGFIIVYFFFKDRDIIEKIALSFALSIAIVPLIVFYLNYLFKIKITAFNVFLTVLAIIGIVSFIAKYTQKKRNLFNENFKTRYNKRENEFFNRIHNKSLKRKSGKLRR